MVESPTLKHSAATFELDREAISSRYRAEQNLYEALKQEIVFILEERIAAQGIKIHLIEARVKELDSLLDKCTRKSCNDPFSQFVDVAAARVVCLFRSDIDRLKALIGDNFDIIEIDDKLQKADDPLGYLSIHITCKIKKGYTGPRYEKLLDKFFEIQLRTLCMHCWAAVSHYVDYKGDWDVPANLKMSLNALGGLFYVADSEFEQFYAASVASRRSAEETAATNELAGEEINLDTIAAYIKKQFPNRQQADHVVSTIVQELKEAGYKNLQEVDRDIIRAANAFQNYEEWAIASTKGAHAPFFSAPAAARVSLGLVSKKYRDSSNMGASTIKKLTEFSEKYVSA